MGIPEQTIRRVLQRYGNDRVLYVVLRESTAIPFLCFLRDEGLDIPQKVGVTGHDNDPFSTYVTPALTTVDPRIQMLCRQALDAAVAGGFASKAITLERLIVPGASAVMD